MKKVHPDLRPDKCGVIFEKINDTLMLATVEFTLDKITPLIIGQVESFKKEGISTMIQQFNPFKFICVMAEGADRNEINQALKEKANDSSELY